MKKLLAIYLVLANSNDIVAGNNSRQQQKGPAKKEKV